MTRTSHSSTFSIAADDSGKELACRKHGNSQPPLPLWSFCREHTGINKLRKREKHIGQKKEKMENREMCH